MTRTSYFSFAFALAGFLGLALGVGCDASEDMSAEQRLAAVRACGMNDLTLHDDADLRACEPGNTKKTTICHVPPGNPANAHTLCIGNPAVPHHLKNHDDYLGPCKRENPCPTTGTGGTMGTGTGGSDSSGGNGGSDVITGGSGGVTGGTGGAGGGGPVIVQ